MTRELVYVPQIACIDVAGHSNLSQLNRWSKESKKFGQRCSVLTAVPDFSLLSKPTTGKRPLQYKLSLNAVLSFGGLQHIKTVSRNNTKLQFLHCCTGLLKPFSQVSSITDINRKNWSRNFSHSDWDDYAWLVDCSITKICNFRLGTV